MQFVEVKMKDRIIMKGMHFFAYHGVFKEENKLGQKFVIDADLYMDLNKAGKSDALEESVSYGDVYLDIKKLVEEKQYNLLEALAEDLAATILDKYKLIDEVAIKIEKPEAPVAGIFDYFGVEILRSRA